MVRAVDKADAMLTLSSALQYREPFTILTNITAFYVKILNFCITYPAKQSPYPINFASRDLKNSRK